MREILKYLKPYKKELIFGPLFKLLEAVIEISLPIIIAKIIDNCIDIKNKQIIEYSLLLLGLIIIGFCSASTSQYFAAKASQGYGTNLRRKLFRHISSLSNRQLDKYGSSALVNRITNDINNLEVAIAMFIRLVLRSPFICIGSIIMIFIINIKIGLTVALALIILSICIYIIFKISSRLQKNLNKKIDITLLRIKENLINVRLIRSFNTRNFEKEKFDKQNKEMYRISLKYNIISNLLAPNNIIILNLTIIAILYVSKQFVEDISIGNLIAIINYISQITNAIIVLSSLIIIYTKAFTSASRIEEIFKICPEMKYGTIDRINEKENAIILRNVSFSYNKETEFIKDLNLTIKKGEIIGIIGFTASGKTSLLDLFSRNYDVDKGKILIFEKDIRDYNKETLTNNIKIIAQKKQFFTTTIEENVKMRRKCKQRNSKKGIRKIRFFRICYKNEK